MFKRSMKKVATLFTLLFLGSVVVPGIVSIGVYADSLENVNTNEYTNLNLEKDSLTNEEMKMLEPYVELTADGFVLKENPYSERINELARETIKKSNTQINNIQTTKFFDRNNKIVKTADSFSRSYGKTAIEYYWNFVRIFIDAGVMNTAISAGISIAGVYVPYQLVQAALVTIGVVVGRYPLVSDGFWFDYNYYYGTLVAVAFYNPYALVAGITQFGWQ